FQAEDGIRDFHVTGVQTCALPIFVHLRRGVPQRRADLIHRQLDDGALLALLGLVGALLEAALHHHPHALGQGLADVLGELPPRVAAQEQGLAVFPLAGGAVEDPGRGRDREVRDRRSGRGEPQFRVGGEIADHRDYCFSSHAWRSFLCSEGGFRALSKGVTHAPPYTASHETTTTGGRVHVNKRGRTTGVRHGRLTAVTRELLSLSCCWQREAPRHVPAGGLSSFGGRGRDQSLIRPS